MSISFWTRDEAEGLNLSNANACDLLRWLGYEAEPVGTLRAGDLAARCRRRLWPEPRNQDPAIPGSVDGRMIDAGRPADYLRDRTARLLAIAECAPEGIVRFG